MSTYIPKEPLFLAKVLSPGKIPRNNPITNIRSFSSGQNGLLAGRGVQISSVDPGIVNMAASASLLFAGVSADTVDSHETDYTTPAYASGAAVGVVDQGPVLVYVEEAIVLGTTKDVRVRITASGAYVAGSFRTTSDAGKTIKITSGAEWRSSSASGINQSSAVAELFLMPPFAYTAD